MKVAVAVLSVVTPAYIDLIVVGIKDNFEEKDAVGKHYTYIDISSSVYDYRPGAYRMSGYFRQGANNIVEINDSMTKVERLQYGQKVAQMFIDEFEF